MFNLNPINKARIATDKSGKQTLLYDNVANGGETTNQALKDHKNKALINNEAVTMKDDKIQQY